MTSSFYSSGKTEKKPISALGKNIFLIQTRIVFLQFCFLHSFAFALIQFCVVFCLSFTPSHLFLSSDQRCVFRPRPHVSG